MTELSSDHCPICIHIATQHPIARDERRVIEWECFGPALSRRLPEEVPLDTTQHIDEALALFDAAVVSAMDVSARMKPRLTPDYQRIPAEITLLASERNRLRRRWQRTRDPADRAAFNRTSGKLRRDMRAFRTRSWELAVSQMDSQADASNMWKIPSALVDKHRSAPIPALEGPGGQILGRPEDKAEFLADCFKQQFAPNRCQNHDFENVVQHEITRTLALPITAVPEPFSREEVSGRLVELRPRKARTPASSGTGKAVPGRLVQRLSQIDLLPREMEDGHSYRDTEAG